MEKLPDAGTTSESDLHEITRIKTISEDDFLARARIKMTLDTEFYRVARTQANRLFATGLAMSIVGVMLVVASVFFYYTSKDQNHIITISSALSGILIELIAASYLYLYSSALSEVRASSKRLEETERYLLGINDVANADPGNIQQIAASQLELSNSNYRNVLQQAQQSFRWALRAAAVGLFFFLSAVSFLVLKQPENLSVVSLISGALIEVISGINFYLYSRASSQLETFHLLLDKITRFLIANSACEKMEGEIKDATRAEIIKLLVNVPIAETGKKSGKDHQ